MMKFDHGLCLLLRKKLQEIPEWGPVKIHLFDPPQRQYPLIILQPTQIKSGFANQCMRITLSGEIVVQPLQQQLLPFYGQMMVAVFEAAPLRLEEPYHATLRFREHTFTFSDKHGICTVKQLFEAFIHP